jgi:chromosome segregation ATPase
MTSGSDVYDELKGKVSEVETKYESINSKVYSFENKISALAEEREQCYTKLALVYLPEMDREAVTKTLKEVQKDVQDIFEQKQNRRKELDKMILSAKETNSEYQKKLDAVTDKLNKKAAERDKLQAEIAAELGKNPEYVSFNAEAENASKRLEYNKQRVNEVAKEAKEKLPAYGCNMIFCYLHSRFYGTDKYYAGGLAAKLDAWAAKLINYDEANKNYSFLTAMPQLMKIEMGERQSDLDSVVNKLRGMEQDASVKHGLDKVLGQGTDLATERKTLMTEVELLDSNYSAYVKERKSLDNNKGEYHQLAIGKLKNFLKGETISDLKRKARETATKEDDALVTRIENIDGEVREFKDQAKSTIEERDGLGGKLEGLKKILSKFSSSDYESHRSYFDSDFDLSTLVIAYLAGRVSHDHVWSQIDSSQHFKARESSYSSSSFGSSSSHSSDSGFGGGGFSSGGGFGGGGFSSGSGF